MIDPQAEAIKRLMTMAKSGAQRTPLVPRVTADPSDPPIGLLWIRDDEKRAYLKIDDDTTLMVASADTIPGEGGDIIASRSLPGDALMLNTVTSDEIATEAIGSDELKYGSVTGDKWYDVVNAESNLALDAQNTALPGLRVDVPFDHATDVVRFEFNGEQRLRLSPTHFSIGADLPGSAASIHTTSTDVALRVRGSGSPLLLERQNGQRLLSVDGSGNLVINGSLSSLSGDSESGSLAVRGALTVTDQANMLSGLQVAERVDFLAELEVDGQTTLNGEVFLPPNYSAKVGQAVHLRTIAAHENRMILEGVSEIGEAEIQLGTDGPVLRGSTEFEDRMFIGDARIVTSAADGIRGNQIGTDTLTGGAGPGVGNIAAETITGYNIKNQSITSTELSPGAVIAGAIAAGAVGSVELADGSVIDRVVASLGVGKLVSGTLNADEVFMGPSGHIYLGPTFASEIYDERVQIDSSGIRAYNNLGTALAEFTPGGFTLRTSADASRLEFDADTGLELFGDTGERTGYLSPQGEFQLDSIIDGARMSLNSAEGVQFYAGATKNLAYNPGFIGSSEHELPVAGEAVDDQRHVFAGEWAVRFRSTNPNINAPSYVDVPFKNTLGTGTSVTPTRVNACVNPKLLTTVSGWNGSAQLGQTVTRVATLGFVGEWAAQVQATAPGAAEIRAPLQSVLGAQQWAMSAYVRVSAAMSVTASILWYDINNALIRTDTSEPFVLRINTVDQVGMVGVAPSNATTARLQISASLQIPDTLQVSNVLYERASGISFYFDGDYEGYRWDGTPGISTSSLEPVPVPDSPDNLVSIFVWSDVPAWAQIEGRDSTDNASRGISAATRLIPNQWSRVQVKCAGRMDKVRLHYPSTDPSRQTRITSTPVWWSGLQVEADKDTATPFCSGNEPGCRWEGLEGKSPSVRDRDVVVTQISPTLGTTVSGAIVGGSLTSASFFAGRIFGTEITGGRIFGNIITGNQINGDQILAGTIHGDSIAARTIDAGSIKVGTLTGTEIMAGSIHGDRITAGTIQATQIGANAITAEKINAGSVTADKMQANMILSQRIIVGTSSGARVELTPGIGLQAFRSDGVSKTFEINSVTGNLTAVGRWSTGFSGERIEILTDGTQRFYSSASSTTYGEIANLNGVIQARGPLVSNNSGYLTMTSYAVAINWGRLGGTVPASFGADGAGIQSWGRLVGLRYERRYSGDGTTPRVFFVATNSSGEDVSVIHIEKRTQDNFSKITSPNSDNGIAFCNESGVGSEVYITNHASTGFRPIGASAFIVRTSSETTKQDIEEIAYPDSRSSWDIVEGAPALGWRYRDEAPQTARIRDANTGSPVKIRKRNPNLTDQQFEDMGDSDPRKWVYEDMPPVSNGSRHIYHRFPIAEDLRALDANLIREGLNGPDDLGVDMRDLFGVLWDAVDMLIKRDRIITGLLEQLPQLRNKIPPRPQKGDVRSGVGAVVPGRTKRQIDELTGQIRDRIRDLIEDRLDDLPNRPKNP